VIGPDQPELIGRVALATALGALVGLERELSEKAAGLRTLALVALGAASFTVAGYAAFGLPDFLQIKPDPNRIAAQVVSGIGFLGAGIIIFTGGRVIGVTTAGDLWAVAAIGLLCGVGLLVVASVVAGLTVFVVAGLRPAERALERFRQRGEPAERPGRGSREEPRGGAGPPRPPS